jgi:hypothetical protein
VTGLANSTIDVLHNAAASRFEAVVDGHLCVANYHLVDGAMRIHHTAVPRAVAVAASRQSSCKPRSTTLP